MKEVILSIVTAFVSSRTVRYPGKMPLTSKVQIKTWKLEGLPYKTCLFRVLKSFLSGCFQTPFFHATFKPLWILALPVKAQHKPLTNLHKPGASKPQFTVFHSTNISFKK